ncbi:MAG: FecR domain-containing protein, partial [Planctomycetes bacterium]|nr:FecR domain-containing protein [Planctomycetota bacterium]
MPDTRTPADDEAFAALLLRFLDGVATPAEEAELDARLADPANEARREMFVAFCRQRGQIVEALAPERLKTAVRRVPARRSWRLLAAAAAVLLAAVAGFVLLRPEPPLPLATVERATAGTSRLSGDKLFAGDSIETDARGSATILFPDGTRAHLAAATKVQKLGAKRGITFLLAQGKVAADVMKQRPDEPLVIRTAQGEARVLGTKLTIAASADRTRLEVETGRVRLTRSSDKKSAEVAAGQFAEAADTVEPVARSLAFAKISAMAPGSWLAVPETLLSRVFPDKAAFPVIQGSMGSDGVIAAWSGAAFDSKRNRLVVWGGGYTDYHGNELYSFNLETMSWERLTEPTAKPNLNNDTNADGTPNGRATYNGLAYVAHADRFFALGGGV